MPPLNQQLDSNPITQNLSMLNPGDGAYMKQQGMVKEGMTVRELLTNMGIDVEGPVEQLTEFARKQTENAGGISKMQNIAASPQGAPGGPQGPGGPTNPMPPGGTPDMDNLLGMVR